MRLQHAVETARRRFLATQPFERFDVAVLLRDRDGSWRRAAVGGERLAYPASCVKLGYLVAAVHWCAEQGREPDCLDAFARPMIVESNDVATGEIVDRISGAPNRDLPAGAAPDEPAFASLHARGYAERVLAGARRTRRPAADAQDLSDNSGEEPRGFEQLARERAGRNAMSPLLAAELLRGVVEGRIEPQATSYMRALLRRERFSAQGSFAAGLPPGAIVENKVGVAYDTLEDIARLRLPNGRERSSPRSPTAGTSANPNPGTCCASAASPRN
ncbi:MAG: serine hydrolase [Steroidobacteraceae bacterium]